MTEFCNIDDDDIKNISDAKDAVETFKEKYVKKGN